MNTVDPKLRAELLDLLARHSYFERELVLASGNRSNYYVDCKRTLYLPQGAYLAGELMFQLLAADGIEQVGGMATGALPLTDAVIAAAWRHRAAFTGFFVRREAKPHGLQQKIEGVVQPGRRTAVIDDTITTAGSSLEALSALRQAGVEVTAAFALVDRAEGAAQAFAASGLLYRWLFTASEVRSRHAALGHG
ncbi:MAG: orotate phosphoribosyltransferase [Deltaproteobacteria bacterium]|nr:orotate phosphoribosyltransferase [Deltaproteobacteria bacterium]